MEPIREDEKLLDRKMSENYDEIEEEKEKKLVNLIIQIVVKSTLKEYYEKGDQISSFQ